MGKSSSKPKILIAGGGPAGASLACRLAREDFPVTLLEREKFPREKLCGEFISPECLEHFRELEVLSEMISAGGVPVSETVFYSLSGRSIGVPSVWFGDKSQNALSLSRAEMDFRLLEKAKVCGARVFENAVINGVSIENSKIRAVSYRRENSETEQIEADIFVDATGRSRVLNKLAEREVSGKNRKSKIQNPKSRLIGFKAHLENARAESGVCEIYFFRGGYGGLSRVENGLSNHCFLICAETVKKYGGDADKIVENVVFENRRARETLGDAKPSGKWLAVSVDGFGMKKNNSAGNLFSAGDARAFIDPFTGSGMLMALEGSRLLSEIIISNRGSVFDAAQVYRKQYRAKFRKRLAVCTLLRRLAFFPKFAGAGISLLSHLKTQREILARATRSV